MSEVKVPTVKGAKVRSKHFGTVFERTRTRGSVPWSCGTGTVYTDAFIRIGLEDGGLEVIDWREGEEEMTEEKKMVEVPWIDGTTREIEACSYVILSDGRVRQALSGGVFNPYNGSSDPWVGETVQTVLREEAEPPVKVKVSEKIGAVVRGRGIDTVFTEDYFAIKVSDAGWFDTDGDVLDSAYIYDKLRSGKVRVIFEGVGE